MKKFWGTAFNLLSGLLAAGLLFLINSAPRGEPVLLLPPPTRAPVMVHVSGAVAHPGVYSLPPDSRVQDAIEAAGGALPEAQFGSLNLAAHLSDGEKVNVPFPSPTANPQTANTGAETTPQSEFPININTATLEQLETLPGIGPVKAQAIIDYRTEHGPFQTIEEIMDVPGIGPATFEQIKDLITVGDSP